LRERIQLAHKRVTVIRSVLGDAIGGAIALAFYFVVMMPFSLIGRLSDDPLQRKQQPVGWLQRDPLPTTIERAKRQG